MKNFGKMLLAGSACAVLSGGALADPLTLAGTWQYDMTVRWDAPDCAVSEPVPVGPNPFPGLVSFHEGGTMTEYGSRSAPSVRSTGFGSWKQTGEHRYRARHTFQEFDANGFLSRTLVVTSRIKLGSKHGSRYSAVSRLEMTDVSGNVMKFCATIEGARFNP